MTTVQTLAEIEEAIARDEARLAQHRQHLAECEADGRNVATARKLVRLVEKRLAMLNERRHIAEAAEGSGRPDSWGARRPAPHPPSPTARSRQLEAASRVEALAPPTCSPWSAP